MTQKSKFGGQIVFQVGPTLVVANSGNTNKVSISLDVDDFPEPRVIGKSLLSVVKLTPDGIEIDADHPLVFTVEYDLELEKTVIRPAAMDSLVVKLAPVVQPALALFGQVAEAANEEGPLGSYVLWLTTLQPPKEVSFFEAFNELRIIVGNIFIEKTKAAAETPSQDDVLVIREEDLDPPIVVEGLQ